MRKVSCRGDRERCHAGQETICEQFPTAMEDNGVKSNRKPFANSFLPLWKIVVPCRMGNSLRTVSCGSESQRCHAGQETICEQFLTAMEDNSVKSNRKPFAKSFLPLWKIAVSCRMGNYMREVSYRGERQQCQVEQEIIREQFPVVVKRHGVMPSRKPFANSFLWQ